MVAFDLSSNPGSPGDVLYLDIERTAGLELDDIDVVVEYTV